jgi:hypothetical protein
MPVVKREWSIEVLKTQVSVSVHTLALDEEKIEKAYTFKDDASKLAFVNDTLAAIKASVKAGEIANGLNPAILVWRQLNTQARNAADTDVRERLKDPVAWETKQNLKKLERVMKDPDAPKAHKDAVAELLAKFDVSTEASEDDS